MSEADLKKRLFDLLREDKVFRNAVASLLEYRNILDRMSEHDRKFNEIVREMRDMRRLIELNKWTSGGFGSWRKPTRLAFPSRPNSFS